MIFKDYYKILGLNTNKVTQEEIKIAYKEQAKKYHPDVQEGSEERFKDITEAYRILTESSSKRKYDRMWNNYVGKKINKKEIEENKQDKNSVVNEFFQLFLGNTNQQEKKEEKKKKTDKVAIKGDNIETEINVSIEEAFFGAEKKISLRTIDRKNENICNKGTCWNT